jgi:hypothetical protein
MNRSVVVAAITGTIAGVAGSAIGNMWLGKRDSSPSHAGPTDRDREPVAETRTDLPNHVIASLALAAAKRDAPGPSPAGSPGISTPPGNSLTKVQDAFAAHAREVENPGWATQTKEQLSKDLRDLSEAAGFQGFELECRSRTCTGFIEWPSFGTAMQNLPRILHNEYRINSGVRFLPPRDVQNGPCRISVIFEPAGA